MGDPVQLSEATKQELCGIDPTQAAEVIADLQKKQQDRNAQIDAAHSAPLPGPLRGAFAGDPPSLHGLKLLPVTAGLVAILDRIQSPLLRVIRLAAANPGKSGDEISRLADAEAAPEPEAAVETVFCFTQPPPRLRQLLDEGRGFFREIAMTELGDTLHPAQIGELATACGRHFAESFSTIVRFRSVDNGKSDGSVKSAPPIVQKTASAGGSNTSARPSAPLVKPSAL